VGCIRVRRLMGYVFKELGKEKEEAVVGR